jgi:hypothetical protein
MIFARPIATSIGTGIAQQSGTFALHTIIHTLVPPSSHLHNSNNLGSVTRGSYTYYNEQPPHSRIDLQPFSPVGLVWGFEPGIDQKRIKDDSDPIHRRSDPLCTDNPLATMYWLYSKGNDIVGYLKDASKHHVDIPPWDHHEEELFWTNREGFEALGFDTTQGKDYNEQSLEAGIDSCPETEESLKVLLLVPWMDRIWIIQEDILSRRLPGSLQADNPGATTYCNHQSCWKCPSASKCYISTTEPDVHQLCTCRHSLGETCQHYHCDHDHGGQELN